MDRIKAYETELMTIVLHFRIMLDCDRSLRILDAIFIKLLERSTECGSVERNRGVGLKLAKPVTEKSAAGRLV